MYIYIHTYRCTYIFSRIFVKVKATQCTYTLIYTECMNMYFYIYMYRYRYRYMHTVHIHKQPKETEDLPALPKARHIVTQRQFYPNISPLLSFSPLKTQLQESSESFITTAFFKKATRKSYSTKNYVLIINISWTSHHQHPGATLGSHRGSGPGSRRTLKAPHYRRGEKTPLDLTGDKSLQNSNCQANTQPRHPSCLSHP